MVMSIAEKSDLASRLGRTLGMSGRLVGSEEFKREVWAYADGLHDRALRKKVNGHCSLAVYLEFDLHEEELRLDEVIKTFVDKCVCLGLPLTLPEVFFNTYPSIKPSRMVNLLA